LKKTAAVGVDGIWHLMAQLDGGKAVFIEMTLFPDRVFIRMLFFVNQ
jgi:hypothetical protein